MSFQSLLIHTVTIYNTVTGTESRYGDDQQAYDDGTTTAARVEGSTLGGASREQLGSGDIRQAWFTVYLPAGTAIDGLSMIVWGSRRLRVDGEPITVYDGVGPHHIEVTGLEVKGG